MFKKEKTRGAVDAVESASQRLRKIRPRQQLLLSSFQGESMKEERCIFSRVCCTDLLNCPPGSSGSTARYAQERGG